MIPANETELSNAIRDARSPLAIKGGGTRGVGLATGEVLSVAGLSGITLYEPGALTLVAGAGTPLSEIEATLAAENQHLAFEPMDARALLGTAGEPTLGGAVAANASGPRRIQAGACRDALLGVRFVDGSGTVIKNGGRVMKNVTGYDLVKLIAGSHGSLGVLSEVSIKVLPAPAARASILIDGLSDEAARKAMAAALGSPFDVTGAAHVPVGIDGTPVTMIRIEGLADSIAYRAEKLRKIAEAFGPVRVEMDPEAVSHGWRWLRDATAFADAPGDVWRVSVRPSDGPQIAARAGGQAIYDWGGGLLWLLAPEGTDLRAKIAPYDGHATLWRAAPETKARLGAFEPEPAALAQISAGLRAKFDPRGILNPGIMG